MQTNIKSVMANQLIDRLAAMTGESKTQAVTEAVRLRLADIERRTGMERRIADVNAMVDRFRARLPDKLPSQAEMDAWFYDEDGLPK